MKRTILVLSERPDTATGLLNAAQRLADLVGGASITVLIICRPLAIPILAMTDAKFSHTEMDRIMATERRRLEALGASYDRWVADLPDSGITAEQRIVNGDTVEIVAEHGPAAEFIVVARPAADDEAASKEMFRAAIFETSRPVLVVPSGPSMAFGQRVGVAWREDRHARDAVEAAMPLFKAADELHVFAGVRERQPQVIPPECLNEHEHRAFLHVIPIGGPPLGETILSKARAAGVDLLVMGAYYHSPLREQIFGGVTRSVLAHATIPLLMLH